MRDDFQPFAQGKPQARPRWIQLANNEPPEELLQATQQQPSNEQMYLYNSEYDLETMRREEQANAVEGCLYGLFAACCCCMFFDMLT